MIKRILTILFIFFLLPFIILTWIGFLLKTEEGFRFFGGLLSLIPGTIGSYIRVCYYLTTLKNISPDIFIGFGSFFSKRNVQIGKNSSIGAYCVVGSVSIGENVLIASHVSIPSGRHQHGGANDNMDKWQEMDVDTVKIGDKSWIGEGTVIMADVGENCIIGGGGVVVKSIPDNSVAVGNPAKVIKNREVNENVQ